MKNSIGVMVDSLRLGIRNGIGKAAELGAQGIQVYAVSGEMYPDNISKRARKELLDFIKAKGLVVSAVCGDLGGHGLAVASDNPNKIEKLKKILELAKDLEADVVTTHIGVVPAVQNERYATLQEACEKLGEAAFGMGSIFAIETGPEKAETLKGFLDGLGTKGIGVNYDPANLVMVTGDDPVKGVYTLKDYIVHTHAKDGIMKLQAEPDLIYNAFAEPDKYALDFNKYFIETPLGEGKVDFPAYLKALEEIGYQGFLTIEREVGEKPEEDISKAVKFLKTLLDKNL